MTEQLALPDRPGTITGHDHPSTSHEAAERVVPRSGTQRRKVLWALSVAGFNGLTDEEIQHYLVMNPSSERPRRIELLNRGWTSKTPAKPESHDQAPKQSSGNTSHELVAKSRTFWFGDVVHLA